MNDVVAGKTEVIKELRRVITNVESLALRTDIARYKDLEIALHTLRDAMNLLDDCLNNES